MKKMKMVTIPAIQSKQVDFVKCDLCGKQGKDEIDWSTENYQICEVEIRMKTGNNYPEGGSGEEIKYHICPDCFINKLMIWLKEQGAIETKTDWDLG